MVFGDFAITLPRICNKNKLKATLCEDFFDEEISWNLETMYA